MPVHSPGLPPAEEQVFIDKLIIAHQGRPGALLGVLEAVRERNRYKYLPLETLKYVAVKTETPLSRIYSVATFYALFNLQPQGENTICICRGTACHTSVRATCCKARAWNWGWAFRMTKATATTPTNCC